MASVDPSYDAETVSESIRRECSFNKRMADIMALMLTSLYSDANKKEWSGKDRKGLREFLKEDFTCSWQGFAVWDAGNGTVDCHYEASIVLAPTEAMVKDKELAKQLKKNPYMTKEAIHDLFANRLREYLDGDFEYYCTCEDYYEPVVEDYDLSVRNIHMAPIWNMLCPNGAKKTDSNMYRLKVMLMTMDMIRSSETTGTDLYIRVI